MGVLFDYFSKNSSYASFKIVEFVKLQDRMTRYAYIKEFKLFVESMQVSKGKTQKEKDARSFAEIIIADNYSILDQEPFINFWTEREQRKTRIKLKAAKKIQALEQINIYADLINELSENSSNNNDGCSKYIPKASSSSSIGSDVKEKNHIYQYLIHNGGSYEYKLPDNNSLRWIVSGEDKAEDLTILNDNEQLSLDGILVIDNKFINTEIVDFYTAQNIMKEIDEIEYFCYDMGIRRIEQGKIESYINDFRINSDNNQDVIDLSAVLVNFLRTYSYDYSTNDLNGVTLLRETVNNLFSVYFPNTASTKYVFDDWLTRSASKYAEFSVISSKTKHVLLSLEVKSNKNVVGNDLIKLSRKLKETIKSINHENRSGVILCGILMKDNDCEIYCMDHKYDGLYRLILLKKVYFPRDFYEMHQLLSIIPLFQKIKIIVNSSALTLRNFPCTNTRVPEDVVSIHKPKIVRISKRKIERNSPNVLCAKRRQL